MMPSGCARWSSPWQLYVAVAAILSAVGFVSPVRQRVLTAFGIPPEKTAFIDACVITAGANALDRGLDPLIENPDDPYGRPLNYPRVVAHVARSAGLHTLSDAVWLGAFFGLVFIGSLVALFRDLTWSQAGFLSLVICAPPVFFGIERGNLDLLIFGATCVACRPKPGWILPATVPLLASLKLYPSSLCALGLVARPPRTAWLLATFACFGYGLWLGRDLTLIRAATPIYANLSWGWETLPLRSHIPITGAVSLGIAASLLTGGFVIGRRFAETPVAARVRSATLAGAVVFAFCFFLGTNFNYRRIFLILLAPFLLMLTASAADRKERQLGAIALGSVILAMWAPTLVHWAGGFALRGFWLLDECSVWLALGACGLASGQLLRPTV